MTASTKSTPPPQLLPLPPRTPLTPEEQELVDNLLDFVRDLERNGISVHRGQWIEVRMAPRGNAETGRFMVSSRDFETG